MGGKSTKKKTHEQFCTEVYDLVGDEYVVIGSYINSSTKIKLFHNNCNSYFEIIPNKFLQGQRCGKCFNINRSKILSKTHEKFCKEVFELTGNDYIVLGEYVSNKDKILLKHNSCCTEYLATPNDFLQGCRCPVCSANIISTKNTHTYEKFIEQTKCFIDSHDYEFDNNYKNKDTPIIIKHKLCNHFFKITPHNFLRGVRCPFCKMSKGETSIYYFLKNNKYNFEKQYLLDDCIGKKRKLPFDFAVFDNNKNLQLLIEYDGELHYKENRCITDINRRKENFLQRKFLDNLKNQYCQKNNIKLLRIPYWDFNNINIILSNYLKEVVMVE